MMMKCVSALVRECGSGFGVALGLV
ncbi:MAG: hypothetical protein AVDCRST_MAG89-564, partial [uncultured Gemmatimonadetes bacterium]